MSESTTRRAPTRIDGTRRAPAASRTGAAPLVRFVTAGFIAASAVLGAGSIGACSSSSAPVDSTPAAWQVVLADQDGAFLSVWGATPDDVYAVGGPLGNTGFEALVVHFDGTAWRRLPAGRTETYWWVHGSSSHDVWMVGEKGRMTHWDGAAFIESPPQTTATIFGVWAASPTDAWAVGGTPDIPAGSPGNENDVVFHWDGTAWSRVVLPQTLGRTYFKVWGTDPHNLYIVGEAATIWHGDGASWTLESQTPLAQGTLLTVSGCSANEVYAVGGRDVLRSDGKAWTRVDVNVLNDVNGVACSSAGAIEIVGFGGLKQRLVQGIWVDDGRATPHIDLHGAWSDGQGSFWAAGGDFISMKNPGTRRGGTLARYGHGVLPSGIVP